MKIQFRIRTLLVVITIVALVIAIVLQSMSLNRITAELLRQRSAAVAARTGLELAVQKAIIQERQRQRKQEVLEKYTAKKQAAQAAANNARSIDEGSSNP